MKTTEYRCVLIRPDSCGVLAFSNKRRYRLPRISILAAMRSARELQKAIKAIWNLNVFILEIRVASTNLEPLASHRLSMEHIEEAIVLAPLLAVYACLCGRGDWLNDASEVGPNSESYARSLARRMDRAAMNPILMERLCR